MTKVANDGRFRVGRPGPRWHHVSAILSNTSVKDAILECVDQLDIRDSEGRLNLSEISVLMLCAAQKRD